MMFLLSTLGRIGIFILRRRPPPPFRMIRRRLEREATVRLSPAKAHVDGGELPGAQHVALTGEYR